MLSPLTTDRGLGDQSKGNEGHLLEMTIQRGNFMYCTTAGCLKEVKTALSGWGLPVNCWLPASETNTTH